MIGGCFLPSFVYIFIICVILIRSLLTLFVRKKYTIEVDVFPYRTVNKTHKIVTRIVIILIIIYFMGLWFSTYLERFDILLLITITFSNGFTAFVEYKYEREEKDYIISLISTLSSFILLVGLLFYLFNTSTFAERYNNSGIFNNESIEEIEIIHYRRNEDANHFLDQQIKLREMTVEDEQLVNELLTELNALVLRNGFSDSEYYYRFRIKGKENRSVTLYDQYLRVGSRLYTIVGENRLYAILEETDFDASLSD